MPDCRHNNRSRSKDKEFKFWSRRKEPAIIELLQRNHMINVYSVDDCGKELRSHFADFDLIDPME